MIHHLAFAAALAAVAANAQAQFNRDIRPILSDRCFSCHASDAAAKGIRLRLDSEAAAKADLGNGRAAIIPGDPDRSELIRRVTADKPAMRMPPVHTGLSVAPAEIALLKKWIAEGAPWQKHWAFIPPERPDPPAIQPGEIARNPIDHFVLARLHRENLKASPEADRATLIRRAALDVTGLPPTPAEVEEFLRDEAPNAYERLLDRLLQSPGYGERMASRWLDAARYADTNGYQTDAERHMWRWRDWVIESFNRNQHFNGFIEDQIAGDLVPNANLSQKIATGFNRNHRGNSEGGIVPEEYLVEYAVDRAETAATVFLGVTLGCARCHNHKYDPFTQRDYYRFYAYFNNIPELGRYLKFGNTPPFIPAPTRDHNLALSLLEKDVREAADSFERFKPTIAARQLEWERTLPLSHDWVPEMALNAQAGFDDGNTTGIKGKAARLDGKSEISLGDTGDYGFYSRFTLSAWIKPGGPDGPILSRATTTGDGDGYNFSLVDGKLQANFIKRPLDDSIRVETKGPVRTGEWQHVAMTYGGSRMADGVRIYINGKPQELHVILDAINQDFRVKEPLRVGGGGISGLRFTGTIDEVRVYSNDLSADEVAMLAARRTVGEIAAQPAESRSAVEAAKLRQAFLHQAAPPAVRVAWSRWQNADERLTAYRREIPTVMVMQESPTPKDTFILMRGAYDRPGEKVTRGVPEALPALPADAPPNRLGLAKWLTSPANPLTSRVAVNRFWQMFFGTGLVKTSEDFGAQGEWPSHPELLDWLATEFTANEWDVKHLVKTILMSATYRQSSLVSAELQQRDPENRLLARSPRLRLPAEILRDQALAVSGLLVPTIGGPSVKPYQPAGLWSELGDKDYERDKGESLYRRSIYTFWKRTAPPPFAANFDAALREACTVRESRTNTPLQALNLMNDVTFVEAARKLAERAIREGGESPASRLSRLFRLVLARQPKDAELDRLTQSLEFYRAHFRNNTQAADAFLSHGDAKRTTALAPAPEAAAYAAVASLILNLDEAVTKP